jgi:hypothetical protein
MGTLKTIGKSAYCILPACANPLYVAGANMRTAHTHHMGEPTLHHSIENPQLPEAGEPKS